jgi:hypothetical protein
MIPFWIKLATVYREEGRAYRIIQIFHLLHHFDHSFALTVPNVRLLRHTKAVLSADTAISLLHPFVNPRLELLLDDLVEPSYGDVEVQVAVTHVAVSHDIDYRVRVVAADEAGVGEAVSRLVDEVVEFVDGD